MKITNPIFNGGNQQFADTITNDKNITTNITGSTVHGSVATGKTENSFNTSAKSHKAENDDLDAESKRLKVITANKGFIFAILVFITVVLLSIGYYAVEKGLFTHKEIEKLLNKTDDKVANNS